MIFPAYHAAVLRTVQLVDQEGPVGGYHFAVQPTSMRRCSTIRLSSASYNNPHVGFNDTSIHYCIVANLARMTIDRMLHAIAEYMPKL